MSYTREQIEERLGDLKYSGMGKTESMLRQLLAENEALVDTLRLVQTSRAFYSMHPDIRAAVSGHIDAARKGVA